MTLEEKIEIGRKEGHAEGREETRCEMICNMVNNDFPVEMIAKAAGMTEEALRAFAREHGIELE